MDNSDPLTKDDAFQEAWLSRVLDELDAIAWYHRQGWADEKVPFLGARTPLQCVGSRDEYYYKALGISIDEPQPGKPSDSDLLQYTTDVNDEFATRDMASYTKAAGTQHPSKSVLAYRKKSTVYFPARSTGSKTALYSPMVSRIPQRRLHTAYCIHMQARAARGARIY
jgi:hypothetical protein